MTAQPKHPGGRPRGSRNKPGHAAGRPRKGVIDVTLTLPPSLVEWLDSLGPNRSATVTRLLQASREYLAQEQVPPAPANVRRKN